VQHGARFLQLCDDARRRVTEIDVAAALERRSSGVPQVLVDVREESEWLRGHIDGAVYLGRGVLERDIEAAYPDLDTPLVLYCGGGFRSALAADALQRMGYRQVSSMAGGWKAWLDAKGPIST
jgi:rhodanese-related sulfurtransferase